jgi:hypothetical protein
MFWNILLILFAVVKLGRTEILAGRSITYNETTALLPFCGQQQNIFGSMSILVAPSQRGRLILSRCQYTKHSNFYIQSTVPVADVVLG